MGIANAQNPQPNHGQAIPQLMRQDTFQYPQQFQGTVDPRIEPENDDVSDDELLEWEGLVKRWKRFFENWKQDAGGTRNMVFNRRCFSFDAKSMFQLVQELHAQLGFAYRLQIQTGYCLRDIRDNSPIYFWASTNTSVFEKPLTILLR